MVEVATVGLDLAKEVFQVHGADVEGRTLFNRKLRRVELVEFFRALPPCLIGIEACSTAHHWARCLIGLGHEVRLINPLYVKPFVKRGKTDANDAEAINEALTRKTMRFVPVKSPDQQASTMLFKARLLVIRQRTQSINALRSHLAELGITAGRGQSRLKALADAIRQDEIPDLPPAARFTLRELLKHISFLNERVAALDGEIIAQSKLDDTTRRLLSIPGVGPVTAAAIKAFVPDVACFRSSRHFAAWVGLTPKSYSSGTKHVLGGISKMGNHHLRTLFVIGAMAVLSGVREDGAASPWAKNLKARRPFKVAAVALANKTARTVWALLAKGGTYGRPSSEQQ